MTTGSGIGEDTGFGAGAGAGAGTGAGDDSGAKERAQNAASTAADESKHVAGVAAEEARSVAADATKHAKNLVGEARSQLTGQVDDQSRQQKDLLASTLGSFGDDLASMAQEGSGLAADVAHEVADRAKTLSRHLDSREPSELLDDVRRFARQRPGVFLLGALAAGVVVGRLARGTKDAISAAEDGSGGSGKAAPVHVTSGAPDATSGQSTHGQPTRPLTDAPASATGYSSPPVGTGLPVAPSGGSDGGTL